MMPNLPILLRTSRLWAMVAILLAVPLAPVGCTPAGGGGGGGGDGGGDDNDGGTTEAEISSLQSDLTISEIRDLSITYGVPTTASSIQAFYVPASDSENANARIYFTGVLTAGQGVFTINTGEFEELGDYYIGVQYVDEQGVLRAVLSRGVLHIQGLPHPTFFEPDADVPVVSGGSVQIIIDLGDPEGDVGWRVFYIAEASAPDPSSLSATEIAQLGNELQTGTGNAVTLDWVTANVALGAYLIGVSATDSGDTVAATALAGHEEQIVTKYSEATVTVTSQSDDNDNTNPLAPTVVVTEPADDQSIFGTQDIDIVFAASTSEGTQDVVEVFYDSDADFENGITALIASGLTTANTTASISSAALDPGSYRLGVSVDDGVNPVVAAYAPGTITITGEPTLEVTSPAEGVVVRPTQTVTITWTTNVPSTAAEAQVTAAPATEGETIDIPTTSATSATWTPNVPPGIYNITVRLVFVDTTVPDVSAAAPGFIRVSTAPQIIWVGSFVADSATEESRATSPPAGAIFEGIQSEDNLGSAFAPAGDIDGDGNDDFLIAARYAKPFFANPEGIGHGEAYLVYGTGSRYTGRFNVNSVGASVRGITFSGIRTPQGNTETDGLSDVAVLPDVDDDGRNELIFGFPYVESRGHNVDPGQDGAADPGEVGSLEKPNQFQRGGIVIVSSQTSVLRNPSQGSPVVYLDMVGQDFENTCVQFLGQESEFVLDVFALDEETESCIGTDGLPLGSCEDEQSDDFNDSVDVLNWGFVAALAEDYLTAMGGTGCLTLRDHEFHDNPCWFIGGDGVAHRLGDYCAGTTPGCVEQGPNLHGSIANHPLSTYFGTGYTGFYPYRRDTNADEDEEQFSEEDLADSQPLDPLGARIIGVGLEDKFGWSMAVSDPASGATDILVTSPERTARGILFQQGENWEPDWPETGGEIDGLERPAGTPATNQDAGVAYLFAQRNLWDRVGENTYPPRPHQYVIGEGSHCGSPMLPDGTRVNLIDNIDTTRIAGDVNDKIRNVAFIPDFNGDGRNDFAVAAPESDRVYVAFRRDPAVEGDYVLEKLELDVSDAQRLSGALVTGTAASQFGASLCTSVDLNGDDVADLIVGAPAANGNVGEIVIIFASPDLVTGLGGTNIATLIAQGRAAMITGNADEQGYFGFNVTNGGDIDGDGKNDLLVAAPGGTPRYDSTVNDTDDTLDAFGLDLNGDGTQDDVTSGTPGTYGEPDGQVTTVDALVNAGLVYVIWGSNVVEGTQSIGDLGSSDLDGAIIVGRRGGDYFGGGDAGETTFGGITAKRERGRSYGLRAAGDVDGDGLDDLLVGSILATTRIDPQTGGGTTHGGEAYLIYGFER